jgi:hypothetical protein
MTWPTVLGVVAPPEDDYWSYSDYRSDRVWQALENIAKKRGIEILVSDLGQNFEVRGFYVKNHKNIKFIVINKHVPNWYKPFVLAHELGHYQLHRSRFNISDYNKENQYHDIIKQEADRLGERLIRFIKRRLFHHSKRNNKLSINTVEGWNDQGRIIHSRILIDRGIEPTEENLQEFQLEVNALVRGLQEK